MAHFVVPLDGRVTDARYFDPNGNDQNTGSIDMPYRTIAFAASEAVPDQSVYVRAWTYAESRS